MEKMDEVLKQALSDAEAFEMMKSYDVQMGDIHYEFEDRSDDFYITLVTVMMSLMDEMDDVSKSDDIDEIKAALTEIARGLIVYSERCTAGTFDGVNRQNNHLFVAAIYYVCGYEAIASLLLKEYKLCMYENKAARQLFYIISGCRNTDANDNNDISWIDEYITTGDVRILHSMLQLLETNLHHYTFDSLREFIDSTILLHVLRKFESNNIWTDLKHYSNDVDWTEYVAYSKGEHILSFLPSQRDALKNGLLSFEHSFSLGLATSGGKSYITELLIYQELKINPKGRVLYLAPLRSLSRELKQRFRRVCKKLDITFTCKYGGNVLDADDTSLEEAQLLVATPETFVTLEGVLDEELRTFSLIICDEGQLLDDWSRGINYELLLTRLKKQGGKRFLFLSATIPNIEDINTWLGGDKLQVGKSTYRPCEIRYGTLRVESGAINVDVWNRSCTGISFTIPKFVDPKLCKGNIISKKCVVTSLAALKALNAGSVMIFSSMKYGSAGCVPLSQKVYEIVYDEPSLSPKRFVKNLDALEELRYYVSYQLGEGYSLVSYIANGFSCHHADLPQDIREVIENAYAEGYLPLIVCTSTLAEGVNMPTKTLILHNLLLPQRSDHARYMDVASIKNIVGRVGRAGQQKYGMVLVPKDKRGIAENLTRDALRYGKKAHIHGMLYDLIRTLSKHNWQTASTKRVNELLESEGFADGIDLMIVRSVEYGSIRNVEIEEVCKNSLAYKLGSVEDRSMLSKVFAARFECIKALVDSDEYDVFVETGMTLRSFLAMRETICEVDEELFYSLNESNQAEFLPRLVELIKTMGLFDENIKERLFVNAALLFMGGSTYSEIADSLGINVDDVLKCTKYMQNKFTDTVSSVVKYVKNKHGVTNIFLERWVEYLKYGLCNVFEYELYTKYVADRIAVRGIEKFAMEELDTNYFDVMSLKNYTERILQYMSSKAYPSVTIKKVKKWLYS